MILMIHASTITASENTAMAVIATCSAYYVYLKPGKLTDSISGPVRVLEKIRCEDKRCVPKRSEHRYSDRLLLLRLGTDS